MVGSIDYGSSLQDARLGSRAPAGPEGDTNVVFNCGIPSGTVGKPLETSFCFIGGIGWTYPSKVSIETQVPLWNTSEPPWAVNQSMYLVFSANLDEQEWSTVPTGQTFSNGSIDEEWRSFEVMPSRFIKISLCFVAYNFERSHVDMAAMRIPQEPQLLLDLVTDEFHNTSEVQQYIGATNPPKSTGERGILDMKVLSPSIPSNADVESNTATVFYMNQILMWQLTNSRTPNQTYLTCWTCAAGRTSIHPSYTTLFQDIIISTNRSANALQSFISILAFTIYYDAVTSFTQTEQVNLTVTSVVQTPGPCPEHGCPGFISVTTFLGVHLLYVMLITVLYARQVRYSRYASLWHTISHIMYEELKESFNQADEADDKTTKSDLRGQGNDNFVSLEKSSNDGTVEMAKISEGSEGPFGENVPGVFSSILGFDSEFW